MIPQNLNQQNKTKEKEKYEQTVSKNYCSLLSSVP